MRRMRLVGHKMMKISKQKKESEEETTCMGNGRHQADSRKKEKRRKLTKASVKTQNARREA